MSAGHGGEACYHCGQPVPPGADHAAVIGGRPRPMCCPGCRAVAEAIVAAGLEDFYRHRSAPAPTAPAAVPEFLRRARVYDHPAVQARFARTLGPHLREASLILEGITCSACLWLNERHLQSLPGVVSAQINYTTQRARVQWDDRRLQLSDILKAVADIGYLAHPYEPGRAQAVMEQERRAQLKRLAVAGALGMQVMMLAVALYGGDFFGMEARFQSFLRWVSLGLATPILAYSARPFFRGAWRDLRNRRPGMDVPVALGIAIAFGGSLWATVTGRGHVYFDSVAMFVFFLLGARYLELAARRRAAAAVDALARARPALALRLGPAGEAEVPVAELAVGDRVRVRPGETFPADGVVTAGRSAADESLLTGESRPRPKGPGDAVIGGSVNRDSPLEMEVRRVGEDTVLAGILRLLERAQGERPPLARLADRVAGGFVAGVLLLALATALYWGWRSPEDWLPVTVAVLVVTCPCALSLATPVALTAATGRLAAGGLLATRAGVVEALARVTHVLFDKTGTLTHGVPRLVAVHPLRPGADVRRARAVAAALERHSEHPIARALAAEAGGPRARGVTATPGGGLAGEVEGRSYRLGSPAYTGCDAAGLPLEAGQTPVVLADEAGPLACFVLADRLRPDAARTVAALRGAGIQVRLLTGDQEGAARAVAAAAGIPEVEWGLTPAGKLERLRRLQGEGAVAAMVGDGVNDAPVLAAAQVSVAMGGGTPLAAASADMVLLGERLAPLPAALALARRSLRVIRQNLAWALAYNLAALPAAAAGWVAPWMAALGMSLSSLLVVANSLRLLRPGPGEGS